MSEGTRVTQQSRFTVSTMLGRERACQEATGAEGHQGLLGTLFFADANVRTRHYVHKPQNLKSTLVGGLGISSPA